MQFFPRVDEDEDERNELLRSSRRNYASTHDPEVGRLQIHTPTANKSWNRWSIVGAGSALLAVAIIAIAMTSSTNTASVATASSKAASGPVKPITNQPKLSKSINRGVERYSDKTDDEKRALFEKFKQDHKRVYESTEVEALRYTNFQHFLELIDQRNADEEAKGGSAKHGITKFADLSEEEMKKRYLNYVKPNSLQRKYKAKSAPATKAATTSVDWTGIYTTAVKDQGYCGSCWAFSATEQIESDAIRAGLTTTSTTLSEQQIVSCDTIDYGCDGGNTETAYAYVAKAGGLVSSSSYPYTSYYAVTGTCKTQDLTNKVVTIDGYYTLSSETEMETYVLSTGPLSVCLDAESWASYTSGILSSCGMDVDHCVQVVGVDTENSYWKVRNSWGTDWGVSGYIYLKLGQNTCNIAYDPTYVSATAV